MFFFYLVIKVDIIIKKQVYMDKKLLENFAVWKILLTFAMSYPS